MEPPSLRYFLSPLPLLRLSINVLKPGLSQVLDGCISAIAIITYLLYSEFKNLNTNPGNPVHLSPNQDYAWNRKKDEWIFEDQLNLIPGRGKRGLIEPLFTNTCPLKGYLLNNSFKKYVLWRFIFPRPLTTLDLIEKLKLATSFAFCWNENKVEQSRTTTNSTKAKKREKKRVIRKLAKKFASLIFSSKCPSSFFFFIDCHIAHQLTVSSVFPDGLELQDI